MVDELEGYPNRASGYSLWRWVDMADIVERYPRVTLSLDSSVHNGYAKGQLTFNGYNIALICQYDGEYTESPWGARYPTEECLEKEKALCGANYIEAIHGLPDCMSDDHGLATYYTRVAKPFEMLATMEGKNPAAADMKSFSWVRDGVNSDEVDIFYELFFLTLDVRLPEWKLEMPFLSHIDALDLLTLQRLRGLPRDHVEQIVSHPALRDGGGITDEKRAAIIVLGSVTEAPNVWIDILLDPEQTLLEERVITLPLAGKVELSVVRPRLEAPDRSPSPAMEFLEHAMRAQEEFMGVAFPHNHAIALIADVARYGGGGGANAIITSAYEEFGVIANLIAYTYWPFGPQWVFAGGATFLTYVSERAYYSASIPDEVLDEEESCPLAENLADLEQLELDIMGIRSSCPYSLGRDIFLELYNRLGDAAFRKGFGNFYLARRDLIYESICWGEHWSGCYLREAFADGATPEQIAVIDDVVARRYYGRG